MVGSRKDPGMANYIGLQKHCWSTFYITILQLFVVSIQSLRVKPPLVNQTALCPRSKATFPSPISLPRQSSTLTVCGSSLILYSALQALDISTTAGPRPPSLWSLGFKDQPPTATLRSFEGPALELHDIPPIDAVLLSHEDHVDNLDSLGRQLLDGRHVFTTPDGAHNLQPRPGVIDLRP